MRVIVVVFVLLLGHVAAGTSALAAASTMSDGYCESLPHVDSAVSSPSSVNALVDQQSTSAEQPASTDESDEDDDEEEEPDCD